MKVTLRMIKRMAGVTFISAMGKNIVDALYKTKYMAMADTIFCRALSMKATGVAE